MNSVIVALAIAALLLGTAGVAQAELVGYWTLDETSGSTAYDTSGSGLDGAIQGGLAVTLDQAGMIGKAYRFNRSNLHKGDVQMADPTYVLSGMSKMSMSTWVNLLVTV